MPKAKISLKKLIQDSQEFGSTDEHMISRVFFDLEIEGVVHRDLYTNIKQVVGSPINAEALEVSHPVGYQGPFNFLAFSKIISDYFISLVGQKGNGIHIEAGQNIRMTNNHFQVPLITEFETNNPGGGW